MGLLDHLWGSLRASDSEQGGQLPHLLLSALGGGDSHAAQTQGLGTLIEKFQQAGLGQVVQSWISTEQTNKPVSPDQVHAALGDEHVAKLAEQSGMGQGALLSVLAASLPRIIDALTPNGQVPTAPDTGALRQASAPPDQAPGEAEAPRDAGDPGLRQAVQRPDRTEPTPSEDT